MAALSPQPSFPVRTKRDVPFSLSPLSSAPQERGCFLTVRRSFGNPSAIELVIAEFGTSQTTILSFESKASAVAHCKDLVRQLREIDDKALFVLDLDVEEDAFALDFRDALSTPA